MGGRGSGARSSTLQVNNRAAPARPCWPRVSAPMSPTLRPGAGLPRGSMAAHRDSGAPPNIGTRRRVLSDCLFVTDGREDLEALMAVRGHEHAAEDRFAGRRAAAPRRGDSVFRLRRVRRRGKRSERGGGSGAASRSTGKNGIAPSNPIAARSRTASVAGSSRAWARVEVLERRRRICPPAESLLGSAEAARPRGTASAVFFLSRPRPGPRWARWRVAARAGGHRLGSSTSSRGSSGKRSARGTSVSRCHRGPATRTSCSGRHEMRALRLVPDPRHPRPAAARWVLARLLHRKVGPRRRVRGTSS